MLCLGGKSGLEMLTGAIGKHHHKEPQGSSRVIREMGHGDRNPGEPLSLKVKAKS